MSQDGSETDREGRFNPYTKRVATGPTPPGTPESRTGPAGQEPKENLGRYEVWSGKSVNVGEKSAVEHPRLGDEKTFHPELDPGHDTDAGVHRLLMDPRRKGTTK